MAEILIGLDEAGLGPWAGPITAGVVVLPSDVKLEGIRDSKKMTDESRENAIDLIHEQALYWRCCVIDSEKLDKMGAGPAWQRIMWLLAGNARGAYPKAKIIVDGNRLISGFNNQEPIPRADDTFACVSAASILAKYAQCCWMDDHHLEYPQYGFDRHRGYGTPQHKQALEKYGPCPIHRKSYKPIKKLLSQ